MRELGRARGGSDGTVRPPAQLETNRIGDAGMVTLTRLLKERDVAPMLERLDVGGNPAAGFQVEAVRRALKVRAPRADDLYSQNFPKA